MPFEPGDEVVYEGSLGHHNGRVAAAVEGGPVDVQLDGVGLVRTDEGSLSPRYAEGGGVQVPAGMTATVPPSTATIETSSGDYTVPDTPGFAHNDLATLPEGNDVAPTTEA